MQTNPGGSTPATAAVAARRAASRWCTTTGSTVRRLRSLVRGDSSAKPVDLGTYANKSQFWLYTRQTTFGANAELDVRNSVLLYVANNHFLPFGHRGQAASRSQFRFRAKARPTVFAIGTIRCCGYAGQQRCGVQISDARRRWQMPDRRR